MRVLAVVCLALSSLSDLAIGQSQLSQKESCAKFSDAVVQIDAGGQSFGSGFIVSPDGYVLTANHVVRSPEGQYFSAIFITLPGGHPEPATPVLPISAEVLARDYALLKIAPQPHPLPFLELGGTEEVVIGEDATIIGFPFSAVFPVSGRTSTAKFCLSATFAANESITISFDGQRQSPTGPMPFHQDVQTNVVYF